VTQQPLSPDVVAAPRSGRRTADQVVTLLCLLLLLGAAVVFGLLSLTSVFATDSCGTGVPEPAVCNGDYLGGILIGYWAALAGVTVLSAVASGVALARHRLAWPYAVGGLLALGLATVVFVMLLFR